MIDITKFMGQHFLVLIFHSPEFWNSLWLGLGLKKKLNIHPVLILQQTEDVSHVKNLTEWVLDEDLLYEVKTEASSSLSAMTYQMQASQWANRKKLHMRRIRMRLLYWEYLRTGELICVLFTSNTLFTGNVWLSWMFIVYTHYTRYLRLQLNFLPFHFRHKPR